LDCIEKTASILGRFFNATQRLYPSCAGIISVSFVVLKSARVWSFLTSNPGCLVIKLLSTGVFICLHGLSILIPPDLYNARKIIFYTVLLKFEPRQFAESVALGLFSPSPIPQIVSIGLGMGIAHQLIELLDGKMEITSELSKGS